MNHYSATSRPAEGRWGILALVRRGFRHLRAAIPAPLMRVFAGLWAVPLSLATIGLAGALALDAAPEDWFAVDANRAAGARAMLSVVATSVISMVSIAFSLTFVALSVTAQMLSPRMLDFVVRERIVQTMMGVALGTFVFATATLMLLSDDSDGRLAVAGLVALVMSVVAILVTIGFVFRMTEVMRPDEMIARRGDALESALSMPSSAWAAACAVGPELDRDDGLILLAPDAGYVGVVATAELLEFATTHDLTLHIHDAQGTFLLRGVPFATAEGADSDLDARQTAETVARLIGLSDRHEVTAGPIYDARALAEAALRALSPGVNDQGTAIACINRLFDAANRLITQGGLPTAFADDGGKIRLTAPALDLSLLIERALLPVAESARDVPEVRRSMEKLIRQLKTQANGADRGRLVELERVLRPQHL